MEKDKHNDTEHATNKESENKTRGNEPSTYKETENKEGSAACARPTTPAKKPDRTHCHPSPKSPESPKRPGLPTGVFNTPRIRIFK